MKEVTGRGTAEKSGLEPGGSRMAHRVRSLGQPSIRITVCGRVADIFFLCLFTLAGGALEGHKAR